MEGPVLAPCRDFYSLLQSQKGTNRQTQAPQQKQGELYRDSAKHFSPPAKCSSL